MPFSLSFNGILLKGLSGRFLLKIQATLSELVYLGN